MGYAVEGAKILFKGAKRVAAAGGTTKCCSCRDKIDKDSAWPTRAGFLCRECKCMLNSFVD
jgi:hypothetical protein